MISLSSFIGYKSHIYPRNLIIVEKVSLLGIDFFDLLDEEK